jgi:thymidylate kinase
VSTGSSRRPPRVVAIDGIPGSGKTSVVARLRASFPDTDVVRSTVLSPQMDGILRELVDVPTQGILGYEHVMPPGFLRMARIMDAVMQFRYRDDEFATADWLLFDGWLLQLNAPGTEASKHERWLSRFAGQLPVPDLLCYLRVPPEVCCERLRGQGHWTLHHWGADRLLSELRLAHARYEEATAGRACLVVDAGSTLDAVVDSILRELPAATELAGRP